MGELAKAVVSGASLRTNRFQIFVIGFIGCAIVGITIAVITKDAGLVAATLVPLVGLVGTALGFGSNHDAKVRLGMMASATEEKQP